ncbi:DUF3440 domain-containing protein [Nocardiopsis sp. NPDC006198]|uniref:DUF3440 domain-containing protein n=1 Tax=Nocardiopsis sp. NPDC006198 TaxID=3154472 RepID=UPI0033B627AF
MTLAQPAQTRARKRVARRRFLGCDVLTAARTRISRMFDDAPRVCVSFSGGKDSGVVLELCAQEARRRGRRLGVLIVDLEAQFAATIRYVHTMLERHADVLDVYWVCLPITLRNAVSHHQPTWVCWDPEEQQRWVRPLPEHPGVVSDPAYWDWFEPGMEFEDLVPRFADWYSQGKLSVAMVGIRAQESINRWRTIASARKRTHEGLRWTTWLAGTTSINAYPIYDWKTEDVWRFYGKTGTPHNEIYDWMYRAGLSIHQQRLCQPYGDDQRKGLWLFHILEPQTWGKVAARVEGATFGARYANTRGNMFGRVEISKPDRFTWEEFTHFLLANMPPGTAEHYRNKFAKFVRWHQEHTPGCEEGRIPDEGPLDKKHPSWKRMAKVVLTYDYYCKGLSFSPPANTRAKREYDAYMKKKRAQWNLPGLA